MRLLLSCPGCGKRVSDRAPKCPFCGFVRSAAAPALAAVPPALPGLYRRGDAIGDAYRVLEVLGEGGFGVVYLVATRRGGAVHALKTIRDEWLRDEATRALFRKEAELWIALGRHPYLVRADSVEEEHGRLLLVMEYVPPDARGISGLEGRLEHDPPDVDQSLRWAIQFCRGMEYAYSRGLRCHRDIKPANILLGPDGAVRITDFGIAGVMAPGIDAPPAAQVEGAGRTIAGTIFGTPTHMPPEQFQDAASCDERSDVYSFGIVLYQMAARGALPFRPTIAAGPDAARRFFLAWRRLHEEEPPASLDSPLMPVIARCLEKDRAARYPGFAALRRDLEILLRQRTGEVLTVARGGTDAAAELCQKGISLASLGRHESALACYDEALRLAPDREDEGVLHNNRGTALSHLGRLAEALEAFARALEIRPRYDRAFANRGLALARAGRFAEALADCDRSLAQNARSSEAWQARAVALAGLGRREEAIVAYDQALAIDDRDPLAWGNRAGQLLELGRYAEAIPSYDRALSLDPHSHERWVGKATAVAQMGRHEEALACYDEALRLAPQDPQVFYNKGNSLVQLQRYEEALVCFAEANHLAPNAATPWYNRAVAELLRVRPSEAAASLRRYLSLDPPRDGLFAEAHRLLGGIESGQITSLERGGSPPKLGELRRAQELAGLAAPAAAVIAAVTSAPREASPPPRLVPRRLRPPLGPTVSDLNHEGQRHFQAGRFVEALACFERALELDPFVATAHGNRANALFKLGQVDSATLGHERALACNPLLLASWSNKAAIEMLSGRKERALASLREVVSLAGPGDETRRSDAEAEVRKLEQAGVMAPPRDGLGWLGAGARHGARGQFDEAIDALDRALALAPQLSEAWLMKAEALRQLRRSEEAVALLGEALRHQPDDALLWHARGVELAKGKRHEEAVACFDRALEREPRHAASWSDRGKALGILKRLDESIESLERAIALRSEAAPPWLNKALVEEEAKRPADAAHSFRMFLERATAEQKLQIEMAKDRLAILEPLLGESTSLAQPPASTLSARGGSPTVEGPSARPSGSTSPPPVSGTAPQEALKKGLFCQNQGQHERAVEWFGQCLAADPGNAGALAGKGESLRLLGRYAEALPCYEQALDQNPSHASTWLKKGGCLASLARHLDSLAAFDRGIELDPHNPLGWNGRGLALGQLGRGEEALAAFGQALALEPRSPLPRFNRAELLDRLGRVEDARKGYQQFLGVASPAALGAEVQRARQRLAALGPAWRP